MKIQRSLAFTLATLLLSSWLSSLAASWQLTDTGWKAWAATREVPTEYKPLAMVAINRTNIYVIASFWQDLDNENPHWSQLNHWDGTSWTECPNSWIQGQATTIAYSNGEIYVGGSFVSVGNADTGGNIEAQNLGKYTISNHVWEASASGLIANKVNEVKVSSWYNGYSSRTYLYVAGPTSVGNNISCNHVARAYKYSGWNWETMNGGVVGTGLDWTDVTHVSIYNGNYTHTVWAAGWFTQAGSVNSTNLAVWIENNSGTSATWNALGTSGNGINEGGAIFGDCSAITTSPDNANIYGISSVGTTLYIGGTFNIVNGTIFHDTGCNFLYEIGMARVTSSTSLGTWKNTAIDSFCPPDTYCARISALAASGTNTYLTLGSGGATVAMTTGGINSSASLAKRYYEISGAGYLADVPATGSGFTNASYDDVVALNQNCVFLRGADTSGANMICRYEYF